MTESFEEFTDDPLGEEFAFELSRRFLGCRFDEFDAWDLAMEKFVPVGRGIWSWLRALRERRGR